MLRRTPFHSRTSALCQAHNWRRWSGYVVAGSYELTHEWEYYGIRSAAGLIDVSPLFKYIVRGPAWRFRGLEVDWDSLEGIYGAFGLPPQLPPTVPGGPEGRPRIGPMVTADTACGASMHEASLGL